MSRSEDSGGNKDMTDRKIDKRWPERNRSLSPEREKDSYMLCSGLIISKTLVHCAKFDVLKTLNDEFHERGGICVALGHVHN